MKKIVILIVVLLALIGAAIAIIPSLISEEAIANQVKIAVEEKTGRAFDIKGGLQLKLFPRISVSLKSIAFANASWSKNPNMLTAESLDLQLQILPLFSKQVVIDSFLLNTPEAWLEVSKNGTPNWQFGPAQTATAAPSADGAERIQDTQSTLLAGLQLGDVKVEKGIVHYIDHVKKSEEIITALDASLKMKNLEDDVELDASGKWQEQPLNITLHSGSPASFLADKAEKVKVSIKSAMLNGSYDGMLQLGAKMQSQGDLSLESDQLRQLLDVLGIKVGMPQGTLKNFSVKGKIDATPQQVNFTESTIKVDDISGTGTVSANLTGKRPDINAQLNFGQLNMKPYLAVDAPSGTSSLQLIPSAHAQEVSSTWSADPIDFSFLRTLDLVADVKADSLVLPSITLNALHIAATIKNSVLNFTLHEMPFYNGKASAKLAVDYTKSTPLLSKNFVLTGVDVGPLLKDFAQYEKLTGKGDISGNFNFSGNSIRAWVSSLSGNSQILLKDGQIMGINLPGMIRNVQSAFNPAKDSENRNTDFSDMSGSFTAQQGVLNTNDLLLKSPFLRVQGTGWINLPQESMRLLLTPKIVETMKGQQGDVESKGVEVPIIVEGSLNEPRFRPDLESIAKKALQDPQGTLQNLETFKEDLQQLRKGLGGGLKGILGGGSNEPAPAPTPAAPALDAAAPTPETPPAQ